MELAGGVPTTSPMICLPKEDSPWVTWLYFPFSHLSGSHVPAQVAVLELQGLQAEPGTGIQPLHHF